ncbi:hypothetical protein [Singulisphaera sp. PoT]|uniref:hypothetical protein n=1 Tax=Singulisphaera sp. PoT TaxID=3411797 RepID=UPI003BF48ACB
MDESVCLRSKSRFAVACLVAASLMTVGTLGCSPDGFDSIDMDASKASAAQKGMGPEAPKPASAKKPKGQPLAVPAPPPMPQ